MCFFHPAPMSKHLSFKVKLTEVVPYFYKIAPGIDRTHT